jgi:hypothetical protein
MKVHRLLIIALLVVLLGTAIGVFYFYYTQEKRQTTEVVSKEEPTEGYTYIKIFYPIGGKIEIFEKRLPGVFSQIKLAEVLVKEYIEISTEMDTGVMPEGTKILNIFLSSDGILYLNFNKTLRSRFRADILDEYMFLRSLFDTMISNLNINDVVILINNREVETLGGHFLINQPLKRVVSEDIYY